MQNKIKDWWISMDKETREKISFEYFGHTVLDSESQIEFIYQKDKSGLQFKRGAVSEETIDLILQQIKSKMKKALIKKGPACLNSTHEILGLVTEEYHEVLEAVQSNKIEDIKSELHDIITAALFSLASIEEGALDW